MNCFCCTDKMILKLGMSLFQSCLLKVTQKVLSPISSKNERTGDKFLLLTPKSKLRSVQNCIFSQGSPTRALLCSLCFLAAPLVLILLVSSCTKFIVLANDTKQNCLISITHFQPSLAQLTLLLLTAVLLPSYCMKVIQTRTQQ